ncbi:hypothetical protein P4159_05765 [Bacillus thuringiensis]|uniref:hypothetical protein n=1 Tax=Bacillus cereus group TaxID=86661 RepID=UPI000CD9C99D|nr:MULTISPECIES: hypothetical protein [Bacillus cereus group]MEC3417082.1 hypothetical protein [Bacillus cereus]MEC3596901.1 hypothetical protein [Bacillus thuringiensis]MED1574251.1 hypothetical protein [Bacillus paranthracis]MED1836174.1 hypothetical protein [Bacillus thuringiensis]MED2670237.1 hypothetical protein [Bacillus thuringiensis]
MSRYDGLEVLENSSKYGGYTQITNLASVFAYRVSKAGIVSLERMMLLSDMLTFKHGDNRPNTSQDTFANRFGCSVKVIKEAVKDLKDSRLINIFKKGRSNSYDLSPYLKCLASFVEQFQAGATICIKRLIEDVLSGVYVPQMMKEKEQPIEPKFDEEITAALDKLPDADRKAAIPIIEEHGNKMSSKSVVFYIERAMTKERFEGYFFKCMENGSDEIVANLQEAAANRSIPKPKAQPKGRKEQVPDWLHKKDEEDDSISEIKSYINLQVTEKGTELTDEILNEWINGNIGRHGNDIDKLNEFCKKENEVFMSNMLSKYKRKDA